MKNAETGLTEAISKITTPSGANWGQERRLEFIDFRLRWEKTVNRADLRSHFGISIPQASLDIAKYTQMAPQNLVYDHSSRTYRVGEDYAPTVGNTNPHRYLNELLACSRGLLDVRDTYIGWMPPFADVPVPSRLVEGSTLSLLLDTIRHQRCVRITYQSDSEAAPIERVISPHAFGYDGFRWHVRAYCFLREDYRDFVLGRILNICADATQGRDSKHDIKWHRFLQVKIAANPNLTEGNRRAVELDYSMADGKIDIKVREALLYYVLKQLGLGPFAYPGAQPPQIVLLNPTELALYIEQMFSSNKLPVDEAVNT